MKRFAFLVLSIAMISVIDAQEIDCSCNVAYKSLVNKLETNYASYYISKGKIAKPYERHKRKYDQITLQTQVANCALRLDEFLQFFKDEHLFIAEYPYYSGSELAAFKTGIRNNLEEVGSLKRWLVEAKDKYPLEGLWTDGTYKYVIKKSLVMGGHYAAVILEGPEKDKIGETRFIMKADDHGFKGKYYSNDYAPAFIKADLYKSNSLLYISGGRYWGRLSITDTASIDTAHLYKADIAGLRFIDEQFAVLTIPSFLTAADNLDTLLLQNRQQLAAIPYLIIDIRGNIGGNSSYDDLMSLYYQYPIPGLQRKVLASADNQAYFQLFSNASDSNTYTCFQRDLEKNYGKLVDGPDFKDIVLDTYPSQLKRIVIITDKANMGAAEMFVLQSKITSAKVMVMGEPTRGAFDYNDINMLFLKSPKQNILFAYPVYAQQSKAVPAKEDNNTDITPDVLIPGTVDKVQFVINWLKTHGE